MTGFDALEALCATFGLRMLDVCAVYADARAGVLVFTTLRRGPQDGGKHIEELVRFPFSAPVPAAA